MTQWEPTEAEIRALQTAWVGALTESNPNRRATTILRVVGPLIAARALRETREAASHMTWGHYDVLGFLERRAVSHLSEP